MVKQVSNLRRSKTFSLAVGLCVGVFLVVALTVAWFMTNGITSSSANDRNKELMAKAQEKLDASICDQIKGGLTAIEAVPVRHDGGAILEGRAGVPAKDEAQTKEQCRASVTSAIERQDSAGQR